MSQTPAALPTMYAHLYDSSGRPTTGWVSSLWLQLRETPWALAEAQDLWMSGLVPVAHLNGVTVVYIEDQSPEGLQQLREALRFTMKERGYAY